MVLVKFIAAENKIEINDKYEYIKGIFDGLNSSNLINNIMMTIEEIEFGVGPVKEIGEDENIYFLEFNSMENGKSDNWEIFFQYGTYGTAMQLEVSIQSDTYLIEHKNNYLEKLKLEIKKSIVKDWKGIIWLIDKDSECLSIDLYSKIYKTENLLRELINEVMNKQYGTSWWDSLVTFDIREKHKARVGEYKTKVPSFNNVDEKLMSIDIDDLGKIITLVRYKWCPLYDEELSCLINGVKKCNDKKIKDLLEKQRVEDINLWKDQFSKYLPDDFCSKFQIFAKDRNHIMHNKLIDRVAYTKIESLAKEIEENLLKALENQRKLVLSNEEKLEIKNQRKIERQMLEELEHECRENDANVSIRSNDEIISLFEDSLEELINDLKERFRFRDDLEIKANDSSINENGGVLMSIKSRVDGTEYCISYHMSLVDEEGASSELNICCEGEEDYFCDSITYVNGEVEFDAESGLYMPITEDEIEDISNLMKKLEEFLEEKIINYRESVLSEDIIEGVFCSECGEDTICINEEVLPLGTCTSCGYVNAIYQCDKCEAWFNSDEDGIHSIEDEIAFCQDCIDNMEAE